MESQGSSILFRMVLKARNRGHERDGLVGLWSLFLWGRIKGAATTTVAAQSLSARISRPNPAFGAKQIDVRRGPGCSDQEIVPGKHADRCIEHVVIGDQCIRIGI